MSFSRLIYLAMSSKFVFKLSNVSYDGQHQVLFSHKAYNATERMSPNNMLINVFYFQTHLVGGHCCLIT